MKIGADNKKGSLLGSILLITGCCVGAGMLGLPARSAAAGYFPSMVTFVLCWLFMMTTGLLLLEVNIWFKKEVNVITMAGGTIGKIGQSFAWVLFLFLFYCIEVAYTAGSGQIFVDLIHEATAVTVPVWLGSLAFVVIFGVMIYFGTHSVDRLNRFLMAGLIITYLLLIGFGSMHIKMDLLGHIEWKNSVWTIPVMIISFGYHNLIPSLTAYMKNDVRKMRLAIMIGSAIPLVIYLIWMLIILGIIPFQEFADDQDKGELVTHNLKTVLGSSVVVSVMDYFALFAIVTSFLGVTLSLVDFLVDGFDLKRMRAGRLLACLLALIPPLIFGVFHPHVFVRALEYAGGFGAVILFGVLPALMVWSGRYKKKLWTEQIVPGGKPVLVAVMLFAVIVFGLQVVNVLQ